MLLTTLGLVLIFAFGHLGAVGAFDRYDHNLEHRAGFRNWHYSGSDLGYFAPQILYFDPVTAQETTYPPLMVISAPGYVPDAPAEEVVSSGPRIIVIGEEPKGGPLPRVIYGTTQPTTTEASALGLPTLATILRRLTGR
jgi:hypothetical protein